MSLELFYLIAFGICCGIAGFTLGTSARTVKVVAIKQYKYKHVAVKRFVHLDCIASELQKK